MNPVATIQPPASAPRTVPTVETCAKESMRTVTCLVLGGGHGTRLSPLTLTRSKPAIPFGARYRLIDVPLSNALNSGCKSIFVLTQFLSSSLHKHIAAAYPQGPLSAPSVEILTAEQKPHSQQWYMGTADAVRKNLEYLLEMPGDYFLILSGDQLYQMQFQEMLDQAIRTDADLVIAALPVNKTTAKRMGILQVCNDLKVTDFVEKPRSDAALASFRCPSHLLRQLEADHSDSPRYLGSMGIYLFKRQALFELLKSDPREDFGKHLIPTQVAKGKTSAYLFDGYWEDIGTIEAFYNANIALTRPEPLFSFYDAINPIFTAAHRLPSPKICDTLIAHAIISEGSIIEAKEVRNSILGPRTIVKSGTVIHDSYLMGNEYYSAPSPHSSLPSSMEIGRNCIIRRAIVDSDVKVGDNVRLTNEAKVSNYEGELAMIRDGIIVVRRGVRLPDNFTL